MTDIVLDGAALQNLDGAIEVRPAASDTGELRFFSGGLPTAKMRGGILFMQNPDRPYTTTSGTAGDIILPNHNSSLRGVLADGSGTTPLAKLTKNDTPVFGRFPRTLGNNEAARIGAPQGLLVVTNATTGHTGVFVVTAGAGLVTKIADPQDKFSTTDGAPGKIVVIWVAADAGYQIQNRVGASQAVGWSAFGTL